MRLLLDESLPKGLKRFLTAHDTATVPEMGWAGKSNGELLRLAETKFDVLITADHSLQYQQNLEHFQIAVLVVSAATTRLADLEPLIPTLLEQLNRVTIGKVSRVADFKRTRSD